SSSGDGGFRSLTVAVPTATAWGEGAAEDRFGGLAFFDGICCGFGLLLEVGEGGESSLNGAEGEGLLGEGLEGLEVGMDGRGEGDEFGRGEVFVLGEGAEAEAVVDEGREEVGVAGGLERGTGHLLGR